MANESEQERAGASVERMRREAVKKIEIEKGKDNQKGRKEGRKGGRKEGRCHKSEASNVDAGSSQRPGNEAFSALNEIIFHILI